MTGDVKYVRGHIMQVLYAIVLSMNGSPENGFTGLQ